MCLSGYGDIRLCAHQDPCVCVHPDKTRSKVHNPGICVCASGHDGIRMCAYLDPYVHIRTRLGQQDPKIVRVCAHEDTMTTTSVRIAINDIHVCACQNPCVCVRTRLGHQDTTMVCMLQTSYRFLREREKTSRKAMGVRLLTRIGAFFTCARPVTVWRFGRSDTSQSRRTRMNR